jgi:hypothetical protein
VRAHRIHHALHLSIFYFSCLLHVGGGQDTLPVLVKNVMYLLVKLLSLWVFLLWFSFRNICNVFLASLQGKDEYFVFLLIERVVCKLQSGCALLLLPSGRLLLRPRNFPQLLGFF